MLRPEDALLRVPLEGRAEVVVALGDVNGDGLPDAGALVDEGGPVVVVLLGGAAGSFTIASPPDQVPDDRFGFVRSSSRATALAAAGDVNRDGVGDIAIGAAALGNSLRRRSGSAFVVFGRRDPAPIRLDELGDGGFRIDGPRGGSGLGSGVGSLGDVNGDGRADVAVDSVTATHVVFGKPDPGLVDLRSPGAAAHVLIGDPGTPLPEFEEGERQMAAIGDANGDGRGDLVVERDQRHAVVFGRPDGPPARLQDLGAAGYIVDVGVPDDAPFDAAVAAAGDVDGDGRADAVVGSWVVFGRAEPGEVDVHAPGAHVLALGDLGHAAGAGDVNGDGRGDLVRGTSDDDAACRTDAGSVTVIYGRGRGRVPDFQNGRDGFHLVGDVSREQLGSSVAGVGDMNGDGRADLASSFTLGERGEVRVFTAADTPSAVPSRRPCLALGILTPSARRLRAERRLRLRVTSKEARSVALSADLVDCRPGRRICDLDPLEGQLFRLVRFREPGTQTVALPFGRRVLRALRRRTVTAVSVCLGDDEERGPCAELRIRRRL